MSVNARYRRVTAQELAELQSNPRKLAEFFGHFEDIEEETEDIEEEDYDAMRYAYREHLGRLAVSGRYLDIWNDHQALNFLPTGQATGGSPPLGSVVEGGTLFGDIDVGYGSPRFLTPDEVREAAMALAKMAETDLRARFNPTAMNKAKVYPGNWGDDDWDELTEVFQQVRTSSETLRKPTPGNACRKQGLRERGVGFKKGSTDETSSPTFAAPSTSVLRLFPR